MPVSYARPNVAHLMFQLYSRSVHPELFSIYAGTELRQEQFSATLRICEAGHVVSFAWQGRCVTEVVTTREQPLPQRKRLIATQLRGSRDDSAVVDENLNYHVSYQLEQLDPEVYLSFHEELLIDARRVAVAHQFPAANRMAPGPLSLIRADATSDGLLVHAFHTFPENCAVVKTQSLFEI